MINIAIVDDHPIARRGLEAILSSHDSLRVVASVSLAAELASADSRAATADIAVVDLYLRGDEPALTDITAVSARCPVLVMSASGRPADVLAAIRAGARGYVTKQASEQSIMTAIHAVAGGGFYLSATLAYIVQGDLSLPDQPQLTRPVLTAREEQALSYIARGLTAAQTASRMGISETTVNTHIERIRRKLRLGNKAELTRMAITLEQQRLHAEVSHSINPDGD